MEQAGRAAAAGTRLSGRIVAGLPLLAVPSLPFAHVPFTDGIGVLLVLTGAGLALSGLLWMERLTPRPPGEDSGAAFADLTGVVLSSGLPLQAALAAVAGGCSPALGSAVRRAQRLTRLGASWPQALALSGDDALMAVGEVTRHALAAGRPVAEALEGLAARRRRARAAAFEMELRRAPVLMVIPLTLLILPSYVLLVLAPFLRGM
jgi:Flp pilus assembly protein TadB